MHFTVNIAGPLIGFAAGPATERHPLVEVVSHSTAPSVSATGKLDVLVRGFYTDDDAAALDTLIKEIDRIVLAMVPDDLRPKEKVRLESLLVLHHPDGRADVWLNEAAFHGWVRAKHAVEADQEVRSDDMLDIQRVMPLGIEMPPTAGFIAFMSVPGRRALVFDFRPLQLGWSADGYDPGGLLAAAFTYVAFRARATMTATDWDALIGQAWFPFTCLDTPTVTQMLGAVREGHPVDALLPDIVRKVQQMVPTIRSFFVANHVYARHRRIVQQALDAYERGEYGLATHALFSRAEGVLRDLYAAANSGTAAKYPGQGPLIKFVAEVSLTNPLSLVAPRRFSEYLERVVFAHENLAVPSSVRLVTRHSVAHGVAEADMLDEKWATIALLSLYQVGLLAPLNQPADKGPTTADTPPP